MSEDLEAARLPLKIAFQSRPCGNARSKEVGGDSFKCSCVIVTSRACMGLLELKCNLPILYRGLVVVWFWKKV